MAKRKRKMTLFDVMASGAPVGLQVRDRSASNARPERVDDRLKAPVSRNGKPTHRLSAADELAALRRELGARPRDVDEAADPHRADHQARAIPLEPAPESAVVAPPRAPRAPRKPLGTSVREAWSTVSPKFTAAADVGGRSVRNAGRGVSSAAAASWNQARRIGEVDTRYLFSGVAAVAAVALLAGAFAVGRVLAHRPSNAIASVDGSVRSNVLDVGAREPSANVADRTLVTNLKRDVERSGEPEKPAAPAGDPGVFGGRDPSLNYVVIARFDTAADAAAAADVLAGRGVKSTVEKDLPHWGNQFYLVGTAGFAKISDPAFKAYLAKITKVGDEESAKGLLPKLAPAAYKWQRST